MITAASNIYPAFLFADDTIAPTAAPATEGGYAVRTSDFYHKTFLNAGGYFLEFETDADFHYDANGLGRVQKQGCPGQICISVPFPGPGDCPYRRNEVPNFAPVTLCGFAGDKLGSEAPYRFLESRADDRSAEAAFFSESTGLTERYHVSAEGVKCTLSGAGEKGFMIPAFEFDGKDSTVITAEDGCITVSYEGSRCIYRFDGKLDPVYQTCSNRNGIYRVYKVYSDSLEIEIVCVTN